jgi:hypothetical protein
MRSDAIVFVWCEQARRQDDVRWRFSQLTIAWSADSASTAQLRLDEGGTGAL